MLNPKLSEWKVKKHGTDGKHSLLKENCYIFVSKMSQSPRILALL